MFTYHTKRTNYQTKYDFLHLHVLVQGYHQVQVHEYENEHQFAQSLWFLSPPALLLQQLPVNSKEDYITWNLTLTPLY
jgi:hypothetical protein